MIFECKNINYCNEAFKLPFEFVSNIGAAGSMATIPVKTEIFITLVLGRTRLKVLLTYF